jgi:hypothetical protein
VNSVPDTEQFADYLDKTIANGFCQRDLVEYKDSALGSLKALSLAAVRHEFEVKVFRRHEK